MRQAMTKQNPVAESFSKEVGPTIKDKKGEKSKSHLIPLRLTLKISFVFGPTPLFKFLHLLCINTHYGVSTKKKNSAKAKGPR